MTIVTKRWEDTANDINLDVYINDYIDLEISQYLSVNHLKLFVIAVISININQFLSL